MAPFYLSSFEYVNTTRMKTNYFKNKRSLTLSLIVQNFKDSNLANPVCIATFSESYSDGVVDTRSLYR